MASATKLYHFTPKHYLHYILDEGITRGVTPIKVCNELAFFAQQQWLTTNADFKQSWEENSSLPYRRNDSRLQVKIPKNFQKNILDMQQFIDRFGGYLLEDFFGTPDYEDWRVYLGTIPRQWVSKINPNPELLEGVS